VPDQPFKKQLDDIYTKTRQAITNTDALHNKQGNNIARKKQQQLVKKAPKKSHKEIFKDKIKKQLSHPNLHRHHIQGDVLQSIAKAIRQSHRPSTFSK
jgi:hypothetical protein